MRAAVLDVDPVSLRGTDLKSEPGVLVHTGKRWESGLAALKVCRVYPRHCYAAVWEELGVAPLDPPVKKVRHHADLAIHQLNAILSSSRAKEFAVLCPSNWSEHNLGVMASVLEAAGKRALVYLPRALALAAATGDEAAEVMEVYWTRAVLSRISGGNLVGTRTIDECGRLNLLKYIGRLVAEKSLAASRYDPLFSAEAEQDCSNRILLWLSAMDDSPDTPLRLQTPAGETVELTITPQELTDCLEPMRSKLRKEVGEGRCVVDDHCPADLLLSSPVDMVTYEQVVQAMMDRLPDSALAAGGTSLRSLPTIAHVPATEPGRPADQALAVTHLLRDGVATPVDAASSENWVLGQAVQLPEGESVAIHVKEHGREAP